MDRIEEAVLDTNVLLDCLVFDDPAARAVKEGLRAGRLRWVASEPMLEELRHVLARPLHPRWDTERERALTLIHDLPLDVVSAPTVVSRLHCTDADDQKFIDLAIARGTRWLLTRDRALLRLRRQAAALGVSIVPPAAWPGP